MTTRQTWTLALASIAAFMLLLDLTIVAVALVDIQRSLNASFDDLQWIVDAYALSLAAFLLTAGALADRAGRRRVFLVGQVVFTIGSIGCGVAQAPLALLLSRGLQGLGGAILLASGPALIASEFPIGPARNRAFAVYGGVSGLAIATGPLVGGLLTAADWRWIFLVNVPIGLLCLYLARTKLGESVAPERRPVGWVSAAMLCTGLFLLVYALIRGDADGWGSGRIVGAFAAAGVLLAAFLWRQAHQASPLLDLRLFGNRMFSGACLATMLANAAVFPAIFLITLYLQDGQGYTPLEAGVRLLPLTGALFVASALTATLSVKAPPNLLLAVALLLSGGGLILIGTGLDPHGGWTTLLPGFLVCGFGVGVFNVVRQEITVSAVAPHQSGEASGTGSTFMEIGVALGIATFGTLFQNRLDGWLAEHGRAVLASGTSTLREGYTDSMTGVLVGAGVLLAVVAPIALLMIRRPATAHIPFDTTKPHATEARA